MADLEVQQPQTNGETTEDAPGFSFLGGTKEPEPCQNFRLDTTGATFGMCKCGHPKASHKAKEENKAAQLLSRLKAKNKSDDASTSAVIEPGDRPCNKYRVDTTADEFGLCKCGFKRAEHYETAENKAKQALNNLKSSNADKLKDLVDTMGDGPCGNYRVDTTASEFGVCHCGYKKEDHVKKEQNAAAKMLQNLKERNKERNDKEDMEAIGLVEAPISAELRGDDDVDKLNKQEAAAESENQTKKKKKNNKKNGKNCVIS